MERIALAREYRVAQWLRDAYLELTQNKTLDFEELRPATIRDWETLARIFYLQTKVAASAMALVGSYDRCRKCGMDYDMSYLNACLCKCRVLAMVDEVFRGELESLKENPEHVEPPIPSKLQT